MLYQSHLRVLKYNYAFSVENGGDTYQSHLRVLKSPGFEPATKAYVMVSIAPSGIEIGFGYAPFFDVAVCINRTFGY